MGKKTTYQGLTKEGVEESRRLHGANVLTPPEKASLWSQFIEKFEDPIIRILLFAWLLSMVIAGVHCWGPEAKGMVAFLEPMGIFFAIMLASCVGFFFEWKANKAFDVLNMVNDDVLVKVLREGHIVQVPRREVVVGDIVFLETGEEVPADGRLLEAVSLQVNESTLTGEPVISKTTCEADFDQDATYPSNVVMRGTTVVDGHGVMKVEQVGDATAYGKVYEGAQIDNGVETPLQMQLKGLADVISKAGYAVAGLTFVALTAKLFLTTELHAMPWMELFAHVLNYFMVAVTLIVVSVPEGLPMSVTLSLALSMNRMLKTNNLVRKMHACETMGATTVICTDKTGTLTQNQMRVYQINFYGLPSQTLGQDVLSSILAEGIAVNSTAFLECSAGKVKTMGNPTEAALLLWLHEQGVDYMALRDRAELTEQLTFSTERKYMATVVRSYPSGKHILYVKGAPEIVLSHCQWVDMDGKQVPVKDVQERIERQLQIYQGMAMRTLGFAYQVLDDDRTCLKDGRLVVDSMTFLGIVAISDPIRQDVPDAVSSCLRAGIEVKIVTGDTPGTAKEIGRQIGIWKSEDTDWNWITGPAFEALSDQEALDRVMALKIMCRARPTDKQRLVRLLQQRGAVVAVTGDGTNDAPALKASQVGLSMGDGTSVAKEASDITILDNSFSSITRAVMWGRSLYRNIQKFLLFQLTINVAACLIVLLGSLIGTESPLTITQMLWVNLIMDTFAAGALASLPPNERVMQDRPRRSGVDGDFIITRPMAYAIFGVGALFVLILLGLLIHFHASDGLSSHDLAWFFSFFVLLQFWNMFNAKAFMEGRSAFAGLGQCKSFLFVAAVIIVGQYLIVSFGGEMFSVVPLSMKDWAVIIGSSSVVLWAGELWRFCKRWLEA